MKVGYKVLNAKLEILLGELKNQVFNRPVTLEEFEKYLKIKIDRGQFYRNRNINKYRTKNIVIGIHPDLIDENYDKVGIEITLELDEKDRIIQILKVKEYIVIDKKDVLI